jgi:hypothetical protein
MRMRNIQMLCATRRETMSLDFYNSQGQPYAYSDNGETIYSFPGVPIAHIDGDSIYSFSGAHAGYFNGGMIQDRQGGVLLFTSDANGGPMEPMTAMRPIKGMKQMKPMRPMSSLSWSASSPEEIFGA